MEEGKKNILSTGHKVRVQSLVIFRVWEVGKNRVNKKQRKNKCTLAARKKHTVKN